jgi:hypothetical protein
MPSVEMSGGGGFTTALHKKNPSSRSKPAMVVTVDQRFPGLWAAGFDFEEWVIL